MIHFKDTLRLVAVFMAYGITGHLDHEDEVLLEQSLAAVPAPICLTPSMAQGLIATAPASQSRLDHPQATAVPSGHRPDVSGDAPRPPGCPVDGL